MNPHTLSHRPFPFSVRRRRFLLAPGPPCFRRRRARSLLHAALCGHDAVDGGGAGQPAPVGAPMDPGNGRVR
jgi:hypothetical protein